jgi:hypothetical protein
MDVTLKKITFFVSLTSGEIGEEVFLQAATNFFQKLLIVCVVDFSPKCPMLPAEYSLMNSLATHISLRSE